MSSDLIAHTVSQLPGFLADFTGSSDDFIGLDVDNGRLHLRSSPDRIAGAVDVDFGFSRAVWIDRLAIAGHEITLYESPSREVQAATVALRTFIGRWVGTVLGTGDARGPQLLDFYGRAA